MVTEKTIRQQVTKSVRGIRSEIASGRCPGFEEACDQQVVPGDTHCKSCGVALDVVIATTPTEAV